MSIIAGALALGGRTKLGPDFRTEIRRAISRSRDHIIEFEGPKYFLAKVDIGVFGAPATCEDKEGNVSLLAGEPLLRARHEDGYPSRAAELQRLHDQWIGGDWSGLEQCTGAFCAVHYDSAQLRISLISDKLGLRPIYYWLSPDVVVFATALRILEEIRAVRLALDLRGVTETAVFGYPLGERTPYAGISTIGAGQIVRLSAKGIEKSSYWRWDRLPPVEKDLSEVATEARQAFLSAVDRRLRGEKIAVAFLSGGLDSRSIASALLERGVRLHTLNHALEGTQDRVFADQMARVLGTRHHQLTPDLKNMYAFRGRLWNQGPVLRWFDSEPEVSSQRRLVWSGDGGSVGVGHVYLNHDIVRAAQSGNMDAAIDAFMLYNRQGVHRRIFKPDVARAITAIPRQGIQEELARLNCADPGRAFHLFLMLNDQRRHMVNLYENIDVDRLELQTPFFDSAFLEPILASRVEGFLGHAFYMKWLENFPQVVTSSPWQAYPGHVPCPLPIPEGLRYQWKDLFSEHLMNESKRDLLSEIDTFKKSPDFPLRIINRPMLQLAVWLTRLGIRNYDYALRMAAVYCRYSAGGSRWQ